MSASIAQVIEADCSVLLLRALLGKEVVAFGEDGLGKYGTSDRAHRFTIDDVQVDIELDDQDEPFGAAFIHLDGYHCDTVGDIVTDQNFLISLSKYLKAEHIDPACLKYAEIEIQGSNFVTMYIDIPTLLQWA